MNLFQADGLIDFLCVGNSNTLLLLAVYSLSPRTSGPYVTALSTNRRVLKGTCSARNRTLCSLSSSKVSPRIGLNGFQVRSLPPKGPKQNAATQAILHHAAGCLQPGQNT